MDKNERNYLKRLSNIIKKNKLLIISIFLIFMLAAYYYSYNIVVPKYKSVSTILLTSNNITQNSQSVTQNDISLNNNLIVTYGTIIKSSKVLNQVINNLQLDNITEKELYNNIKIEEIKDTQVIKIEVVNESPIMAQKIAENLDSVFIEEIKQFYKIDNINIVDAASLETEPYNIHHVLDVFVFFAIGCTFVGIILSIFYVFDTTIKIEQDIEEYTDLNVIGVVPLHKLKPEEELILQKDGKSVISEAFKTIRTNISFSKKNKQSQTVLFTSCNASEGKSWITSNMAVAYAYSNKNVIIIDADMRKGRQHNIFGVSNENGLSNILRDLKNRKDYKTLEKYIKETDIPKIHIITIGTIPPNPSELLSSNKLADLIYMLKCMYDVVIIDGTPCNLVSDIIPVSREVDSTVLVAESRKTKIEDLKNIIKAIRNVGGRIEGVILNKKEIKGKEYKKGYYYTSSENTDKVEIQSYTVKELVKNRKKYTEDINEEVENSEKVENNEQINLLNTKVDELKNIVLEMPKVNLQNYLKSIEDIRKIYDNELDKNKIAENIKDTIVNNELMKKIEDLNDKDRLEELTNRVNSIEKTRVNDNLIIVDRLNNIQNNINQNNKMPELLTLKNKLTVIENTIGQTLKDILEGYMKELDDKKEIKVLSNKLDNIVDIVRKTIKTEEIEVLVNKLNDIENTVGKNVKTEELDDLVNNLNIIQSMINQSSKTAEIENLNEKLNSIQSMIDQNSKTAEIEDLNEKLNSIQNMIDQSLKIAEIEDLNKRLNNIESKISQSVKTEEIESLINKLNIIENIVGQNVNLELKKINEKYENLVEQINSIKQTEEEVEYNNPLKDKIIELNKIKEKMKKEELVVKYGQDVSYDDLLELAIDIYEEDPDTIELKKSSKIM